MPEPLAVFEVKEPHITVRLYENLLKIDLRGSFKNEIEEALENKPILKETFGSVLGIFVPLHIRLTDIKSVHMDETGKIKVKLPLHRDTVIPLERNDAKRLLDKLNQLISNAKKKDLERMSKRARHLKKRSEKSSPSSYVTVPYYFPTEQVDNVSKLQSRKKRKKR